MKKHFFPTIILLVSLTFLMVGVIPAFNNYREAGRLLKDKQKNQDQLTAKMDSLNNIDEFQQDRELRLAIQSLPALAPYQQTLTLLDELSKVRNITISGLEITSSKEAILLKLTAVGELIKLEEFAKILNRSLPVSATNKIELSKSSASQEASPSASYSAELEIAFQFKPTPQTVGKASDPLPVISGNLEQALKQLREFNVSASKAPLSADQVSTDRVSKLFPD